MSYDGIKLKLGLAFMVDVDKTCISECDAQKGMTDELLNNFTQGRKSYLNKASSA
jgi:hypothetical protein